MRRYVAMTTPSFIKMTFDRDYLFALEIPPTYVLEPWVKLMRIKHAKDPGFWRIDMGMDEGPGFGYDRVDIWAEVRRIHE